MTNYEKIKNMSIEELSKVLLRIDVRDISIQFLYGCDAYSTTDCFLRGCVKCYIRWLESEADE